MNIKFYIFILSLSFFCNYSLAKEHTENHTLLLEQIYTNYTTQNGLPSNESYCLLQDSKGYIWIGTDRGLVRYDGYEFITYTTQEGLTDNVILAIAEDKHGNIWYSGLNNTQLGYIDSKMNFHKYKHYEELYQKLKPIKHSGIYFNQMFIDGTSIFLVNNKVGYVEINDQGVQNINIPTREGGMGTYIISEDSVGFIFGDPCGPDSSKHDTLFFNNKPIYSIKLENCILVHPSLIKHDSLRYVYNSNESFVLKDTHVIKHKTLEKRLKVYSLSEHKYIFLERDDVKKSWVTYYSESPILNEDKIKILENEYVSGVIEDGRGRIWLSTSKNGLYYFPDLHAKKTREKRQVETLLPLKDKIFIELDENTENDGLIYNKQTERIINYESEIVLGDLLEAKTRMKFFGTIRVKMPSIIESGYGTKEEVGISGIQYLSDSLIYVWNSRSVLKIKNGKVYYDYYESTGDYDVNTKEPRVRSAYCISEDNCYIAASDGIYHYLGNDLKKQSFGEGKYIKEIIYNHTIKALIYSVWGEGIVIRYDSGKVITLNKSNGLVSNFINQFFEDDNGVIWMASNKGINTLTLSDTVKVNTELSGSKLLSSPNILQLYLEDSVLYLGTDAGFNILNLKSLEFNDFSVTPLILDSIYVEGLHKTDLNTLPDLNYKENNLTFYYTAIAYNKFGNINYRYRLKGLSENWVYTKERKVSFLKVIPGQYTFELEVQNEIGDWVGLEHSPQFTIDKPYWEKWWFISLGILICIVLIGGVFYYYISNLKKEKAYVENEQLLSEELNTSRQKALSSQLNPHFVFNSLNSIQNFILTKRTESSSDYLSMFSKLMRFVFENSKKLYVPLYDEVEALRLYLELEQVRHNHKFNYKIDVGDLVLTEFFIPSLLVQPIVENAIWHGLLHKVEGDRFLEVKFYLENNHLNIKVQDNGVGRKGSMPKRKYIKKQESSGVELTKQRLNLLSQSTGLNTSFEIIDLFDAEKQAVGTCVIISIPLNLKTSH